MTLDLAAIRDELKTALTASGLTVHDHLPNQLHPPLVLIEPDDPYITDEDDDIPYGSVAVNWVAHVITKQATPETQTVALDDLIVQTLYAAPDGWNIGPTGRPYVLTNGQNQWLSTRINLSTQANL